MTRSVDDLRRAGRHESRILAALRSAGPRGCTNTELWTICHAVNSRVSDLRKLGHSITMEREGKGVFRYRLVLPRTKGASPDWFERESGKPRPAQPTTGFGPLFQGDR
jgi:hypothetical protein